jgi:hypothetical protein
LSGDNCGVVVISIEVQGLSEDQYFLCVVTCQCLLGCC